MRRNRWNWCSLTNCLINLYQKFILKRELWFCGTNHLRTKRPLQSHNTLAMNLGPLNEFRWFTLCMYNKYDNVLKDHQKTEYKNTRANKTANKISEKSWNVGVKRVRGAGVSLENSQITFKISWKLKVVIAFRKRVSPWRTQYFLQISLLSLYTKLSKRIAIRWNWNYHFVFRQRACLFVLFETSSDGCVHRFDFSIVCNL